MASATAADVSAIQPLFPRRLMCWFVSSCSPERVEGRAVSAPLQFVLLVARPVDGHRQALACVLVRVALVQRHRARSVGPCARSEVLRVIDRSHGEPRPEAYALGGNSACDLVDVL